jgi:CDP-glycerol glycerophosphotransferase
MKIDKKSPRHWSLLLRQALYTAIATGIRPLCKRPATPLVLLYGHQFSGNLKALYLAWVARHGDELDLRFLTLDPDYYDHLSAEGIRVLGCFRLRDMMSLARAAAIVSDHGLHLMSPLTRLTDILFIDVWHGIPFKGFNPDDFRLQHRYDEVWVSSSLMRDVYLQRYGFRAQQLQELGYARADRLAAGKAADPECRTNLGLSAQRPTVLYAPTWQQDEQGRELFPFGLGQEEFVEALGNVCAAAGAELVIRSHLNAKIPATHNAGVHYCSMKDYPDTEALLDITDVLICDWSSIAFDFLVLRRPTLFLDVPPPFREGFSLGPEYRFGEVVNGIQQLCESLAGALSDPGKFMEKYRTGYDRVISGVYNNNLDGEVATRQLQHLIKRLGKSD